MNRKPIFDAVRTMLGRGFSNDEVKALDLACDLAEAAVDRPEPKLAAAVSKPVAAVAAAAAGAAVAVVAATVKAVEVLLGKLSERYESGGRGPGTVSAGAGDPGGVSYGIYQLSSTAGSLTGFMKNEGKPWKDAFGSTKPGTKPFSDIWKKVAADDPAFAKAQHAYIDRTHYRPAVASVRDLKGLDLDARCHAVREVTWSVAVQHGRADQVLVEAINICDRDHARDAADYDRRLIEAMYKARTDYVLGVAKDRKKAAERDLLVSITKNRYPKELADALALLEEMPATAIEDAPPAAAAASANGTSIDGNEVAARNGVSVKSASVKIASLHPKLEPAIVAVAAAAKTLGLPKPVITSGNDSNHMDGSLHYKNRALDFRGNNIQPSVGKVFAAEVSSRLGSEYDVQFELFMNASNNHLHVEFDPS